MKTIFNYSCKSYQKLRRNRNLMYVNLQTIIFAYQQILPLSIIFGISLLVNFGGLKSYEPHMADDHECVKTRIRQMPSHANIGCKSKIETKIPISSIFGLVIRIKFILLFICKNNILVCIIHTIPELLIAISKELLVFV